MIVKIVEKISFLQLEIKNSMLKKDFKMNHKDVKLVETRKS